MSVPVRILVAGPAVAVAAVVGHTFRHTAQDSPVNCIPMKTLKCTNPC